MPAKWESYVGKLKKADTTLKKGLKEFIKSTKEDPIGFIKVQGEYLEMYLDQLAKGEINKDQFKDNVQNIRDVVDLELLKLDPSEQPSAKKLQENTTKLILEGLVKAL